MQYYYNNKPVKLLGRRKQCCGDPDIAVVRGDECGSKIQNVVFSELTTCKQPPIYDDSSERVPTDEYIIADKAFYDKGHCSFFAPGGTVICYSNLSALSKQAVRERRLEHELSNKESFKEPIDTTVELTEDTTRVWPEDNEDKETLNVIGRLLYGHDTDSGAHNFNHESLIKKINEIVLLRSSMNKESLNTQLTESCPCLLGEKDCEICDPNWMPSGSNMINNPPHYNNHPSGIECIEITRHMNFNLGNVFKYLWRCGDKGKYLEDLKKAAWYLNDEIKTTQEAQNK